MPQQMVAAVRLLAGCDLHFQSLTPRPPAIMTTYDDAGVNGSWVVKSKDG
jgi:hypothetical protein